MRAGPLLILLALLAAPGLARAASCTVPPQAAALAQQVVQAVNGLRAEHGLAVLRWDEKLAHAARLKACELSHSRRFTHSARDVKSRLRRADCPLHGPLAENLGHGYLSAQMAAQRWFDSAEHRVNMMHPRMRATGFAWMPEPQGGGYWVMMYGQGC